MSGAETKADGDKAKFVRDTLLGEIGYRRDKMWKLFSWVNTVLTGITGGVVALKTRPDEPFNLTLGYRVALTIAVAGLAVHACVWLSYNWKKVREIWGTLKSYSENDEIVFVEFGRSPVRYVHAVALLGLAAVIVIWL
jgi:hypothetical protein